MKAHGRLKQAIFIFIFLSAPFLSLYSFNVPPFNLLDTDNIFDAPQKLPPPSKNTPISKSSTNLVDGQGNFLSYQAVANVTGSTAKLSALPSFIITTNVWNISYTSLNITNIKADTINKTEESSYNTQVNVDSNSLFARQFTVSNSCSLNNISIFRSALANDILNLTTGGSTPVNYGPINITIMIWNATQNFTWFEPNATIKRFDFNNRKYGWAMNGTPSHDEYPEIGWETFDMGDFYLNTENTKGNAFFISINTTSSNSNYDGKPISSHYKWYLQTYTVLPIINTFNSSDDGTTWVFPSISPLYSLTLGLNVSIPETFYPSNISLKIKNVPVNDTVTANQGLWTRRAYYPYDGNSYEAYTIQSNWSALSFNVNFLCTMNKSGQIVTYYAANGTRNYIEWNSTVSYDLPNSNLNNTIYITCPASWNVTSINPAPPSGWLNYTQGSRKILEIYNESAGNVRTYYQSNNVMTKITVERYEGGTLYVPIAFQEYIDESIRINASFSVPITAQAGNLSLFDFNGVLNYTDQKAPSNNKLSFSNWAISTTTRSNGTYLIRAFWTNGTQVGINITYFDVLYPTRTTLISPTVTQIFYEQSINVTLYYKNDFSQNIYGETGIRGASAFAIFNETSNNYTMAESPVAGYYNTIIDTTGFQNGTYDLNITIRKPGYENRTFTLQIEIKFNTTLNINVTTLTIYYSQLFDIELNYNRTDHVMNAGVNSSTLQILINGTDATPYIQIDTSEELIGNYTLTFNTTNCNNLLLPGFVTITIKISKQGYLLRQASVDVTILKTLTTLENYTIIDRQGGLEAFNITVFYNNTILNQGIRGASFSIYKDGRPLTEVFASIDVNNDTFCLHDFQNGTYNVELNITIGKNHTMEVLIVSNKTGYNNGTKEVYQKVWVWATDVPIFTFSNTVMYGQNQTVTLHYNQTGVGGVPSANVFSNWNDIGNLSEFLIDHANGTYTLTFDTNLTMAGNHSITVNVQRNGYQWNTTTFTFRIAGYLTGSVTYNSSILGVYVNDSIFNIRVRYYNLTDNFNITDANVLFRLRNSTNFQFDTQLTSTYVFYLNEAGGWYNFSIDTTGLHADVYNLSITIEFHNISIAFEYSRISFLINLTHLPSNLTSILQTGAWWTSQGKLRWYEVENITININFKADFYDTGSPIENNVTWGSLFYEIIKLGETSPTLQGQFVNLGNGIYESTINLSMTVQNPISEEYRINIIGMALDIQNSSLIIDLTVLAKMNLRILFLPLPEEIVENDMILITAVVFDGAGRLARAETVVFRIHILTTSGTYHVFQVKIKTVGGFTMLYFQVPYNVKNFVIEASTERSMVSWASGSFYQPASTLPPQWVAVQFMRIAWPFITAIAVASVALYYYKRKYKPKKIKQKEVRDTISYRFKSAANLIHVLVYDQKSTELLFVYSTPGIQLTNYLINSILESISMYDNMTVTRQEIYLRDDACLILHDGEFVRVAMITQELPSVEMQKQLEQFLEEFELKFGKMIPEWRQDISRLARMMDMGFANELIEKCFEKSLIFPHYPVTPKEVVQLTSLEKKLFEMALKIRGKAGPFLLQRLVARGQTELSPDHTILQILEGAYNLRQKQLLIPVSEKEAQKMKEDIYKKGLEKKESEEEKKD